MKRGRPPYQDVLTPREWEVLELVERGLTNEEIADHLGVSPSTAKFHVSEILSKLNLPNRREAGAWRVMRFPAGLSLLKGGGFLAGTAAVGAIIFFLFSALLLEDSKSGATAMGKVAHIVDGDVWVKQLPNGQETQLTNWGDVVGELEWSASGEWLTLVRDIPITAPTPAPGLSSGPPGSSLSTWIIDAAGKREREIAGGYPNHIWWSPVKDEFLLNATIETADGSDRRDLVGNDPDRSERPETAAWAPSGDWVVVTKTSRPHLTPEDIQNRTVPPWEVSVVRMRPDGSAEQEFYRFTYSDPRSSDEAGLIGIVTESHLLTTCVINCTEATSQAQAIPLDGGNGVVDGPFVTLWHPFRGPLADYSPESRRLASVVSPDGPQFTSPHVSNPLLKLHEIGSTFGHLTNRDEAADQPSWSPDGSTLFYTAADSAAQAGADPIAARRIWSISADGSSQTQLTNDPRYRDEYPQVTADGSQVLFTRIDLQSEAGTASLWLLDLAIGEVNRVINDLQSGMSETVWWWAFDWWQPK